MLNYNSISTDPYLMVGDFYDQLKTKTSNKVRYTTYFTLLFDTLLEMFEWKNLPDTIPKRFLESILRTSGEVFVSRINDKLIASGGTLSGDVDEYGLGTECIAVCPRGEARGQRNIDIAYGINNDTATPDMLLYWITHLLSETDKSIKLNVIYSRLLKIPKVATEKDKAMFEELLKKVMDGDPQAFASTNALDMEFGAGTEVFELTDSNKIDKLPYLTQFFDDTLKRFYNFYGQPMQNQNKRAQSISDEIHGQDSVSFIIPLQMLRCRQALADNINKIFGTDISVDFSPLWRLEFEALVLRDTNDNGVPDHTENDTDSTEPEPDGTDTEPTEPDGTETEPPETETEPSSDPVEELTEPTEQEEPLDEPAMELEETEEETEETEEGGTENEANV